MKYCLILICVIIIVKTQAQVNLTQGLQLYLPFNGNALDASGNGNNAIINGASLTTDQNGNTNSAYSFDGINDYLAVPHSSSLALGKQISMVAHVYVTGFYTGLCECNIIFQKGITDFLPGWYSMRYSCGGYFGGNCGTFSPSYQNFYANVQNNNSTYPFGTAPGQLGSAPYIQTNNWYCVISTWDGDTMKVYVDGTLYSKWSHSLTVGSNTDSLTIGCIKNNTFPYWLNGKLDDLRIYNRAINYDEVLALCNPCNSVTNPIDITSSKNNLCAGDTAILSATGAVSYSWSPNVLMPNNATIIAVPNATTTYTVVGTTADGCTFVDSIKINVNAGVGISITGKDAICIKDTISLTVVGASNIVWTSSNNNIISDVTMPTIKSVADTTTTYYVNGNDASNCKFAIGKQVIVDPELPIISVAKSNDLDCMHEQAQLLATGASSFIWSANNGVNNYMIANPIVAPFSTTTYTITGKNIACQDTDTITVLVSATIANKIIVPNVFTPNADNINDCFAIKSNIDVIDYELNIYNRWGEKVFHTKDINACWNGVYNNYLCEAATYYYVIKVKSECGTSIKKGDVILLY